MTRRLPVCALFLAAGLVLPASAQKQQTTVLVTVVASADSAMTSLTTKDFTARGGQVEIVAVARATGPLSIDLVVDVSRAPYGTTPPVQDLRTALKAFVQTIRTGDPAARLALIEAGNAAVPEVHFDASAGDLDKAIAMVAPLAETGAMMSEGVQAAGRALAVRPAPRRAIVAVDLASTDAVAETEAEGIVKDVYNSGATVWAISVRDPAKQQPALREHLLNMIVKNNSGQRITINAASGLRSQLQIAANSLMSQYDVTIAGVAPTHVRDVTLSTVGGAKVLTSLFADNGGQLRAAAEHAANLRGVAR